LLLNNFLPTHISPSGHPFPLQGRYLANIFLHFEPTGYPLGKNESGHFYLRKDEDSKESTKSKKERHNVDKQYRQEMKQGFGGQSSSLTGSLPPYIIKRK
jgi:hypothetical protein